MLASCRPGEAWSQLRRRWSFAPRQGKNNSEGSGKQNGRGHQGITLQLRVVLPHRMVRTGVSQEVAMELIVTWRNFVGRAWGRRPFTGIVYM